MAMARSAPEGHLTLWQALNALGSKGQRVGLYGGSFNPPHAGHLHVARQALLKGKLDKVVFLVTPVSPHKQTEPPAPLPLRIKALEGLMDHPRLAISSIEASLKTTFTADLIAWLTKRKPDVQWVWIAGGDSLRTLHRWRRPDHILKHVNAVFIDRPAQKHKALRSPFAVKHQRNRIHTLPFKHKHQTWVYVFGKTHTATSSDYRQQPDWQRRAFGLE
jgi:nicotinate-nucleotide adenylyltransferase